jgi:predicted N-acyltransferase
MAKAELRILQDLRSVDRDAWNRLAGENPFLSHEFLCALHDSGCASPATGWTPCFPTLWRDSELLAAMPLYLKTHSFGEYVFDWAWAEAHRRHGLRYYPKLLCAVPFTPVTGPRLLAPSSETRLQLLDAALAVAHETQASSLHVLFPREEEKADLEQAGLTLRHGVQFQWFNRGYARFEDFLSTLIHDKRKKIRQERRRVTEAGVRFQWLEGPDIREEDWRFFFRCYTRTYRLHRSTPYLTLDFFLRLGRVLPRHILLAIARREGRPLAAAFFVRDASTLYGRYWGAVEVVPGLHFEACYYQAIDWCIGRGIRHFEGGAQGEHKLARGLLPVRTWSAHWLAHPGFARAVEEALAREAAGMDHYMDELAERSPFKALP